MIALLMAALVQEPAPGRDATRVILSAESIPLKQALDRLNAQAPDESAACDRQLEGRPVRADIAGKPYFEALHILCIQNEGLYLEVGDELRIREGPYVPASTFCVGPYVFQLRAVRLIRSVQGQEREILELLVAARSQKNSTPMFGQVELAGFDDRLFGGRGDDLPAASERWSAVHRLEWRFGSSVPGLSLNEIPPGRERMDFSGEARAYFVLGGAPLEVAMPQEGEGEIVRPLEDKRFTVSILRKPSKVNVELRYQFKQPEEEALWPLFKRQFKESAVEFMSSDGAPVVMRSSSTGSGRGEGIRTWSYGFEFGGERPATVRVTLPQKIDRRVIPIEFKGIPLE
jgi:hypothetical protein